MRLFTISYLFLMTVVNVSSKGPWYAPKETESNYKKWKERGQDLLASKVSTPPKTRVAKNVIFFLGDGLSLATIAATRVHVGHKLGFLGEETKLAVDWFQHTGLARTYCVDSNVPDCACSATACLSGVKVNFGTVGVNAEIKRGDCLTQNIYENSVSGLMAWAQRARKATGIVTTMRVTHPTPAAAYAHSADVRWEADTDLPDKKLRGVHCDDIATQLVRGDVGRYIDVVLGGGRKYFFNNTEQDPEGFFGYRTDGVDLIKEWLIKKESNGAAPIYIYKRDDLKSLDVNKYNSVLGLFSPNHMPHTTHSSADDPLLLDMGKKAVEVLKKNKYGYFLFVEGGRIDGGHHESKARKALDGTAEFMKAVRGIVDEVNLDETLVVVTSDHSHTMTYSGYSRRGTDILGFANMFSASDQLPYTILSYANGPGYRPEENNRRVNLTVEYVYLPNRTRSYPALFPMLEGGTHGGEDVAVYAIGPWSHLFTGTYEQTYLPYAIGYAACIGPGYTNCVIHDEQ